MANKERDSYDFNPFRNGFRKGGGGKKETKECSPFEMKELRCFHRPPPFHRPFIHQAFPASLSFSDKTKKLLDLFSFILNLQAARQIH